MGRKLFTFQDEREKIFVNLINRRRCIGKFLSSLRRLEKKKKFAHTLFEGHVRGNISDVNGAAPIIHEWKQTSLSEVFLGISLNITATLTFQKISKINCIL